MRGEIVIRRYRDDDQTKWDAFVSKARNKSFLFLRPYMNYHRDRFHDHSLLIYKHDHLVALLPANEEFDELVSHQGLTFGGLLVLPGFKLEHAEAVFEAVAEYACLKKLRRLIYRPSPHCYHEMPTEEDLVAILRLGGVVAGVKGTSVIRLKPRIDFAQSRRTELRRARAHGVHIERDRDIETFMHICAQFLGRRLGALPVHTADEMAMLASEFPNNIVLLTAKIGAEFAAGVILYENPVCTRVQYIAYSEQGRRNCAVTALYHEIVSHHLDNQLWLDLGPSQDPITGELNAGVAFFKESFGARTIAQVTCRLDFS